MQTRIFVIIGLLIILSGFISVVTQNEFCVGGGAELISRAFLVTIAIPRSMANNTA